MVIAIAQPTISVAGQDVIVSARDLRKQYKDGTEALKRITLDIKKGDLFGLIGPDGAGKSTTLRILAGVMEPSGGEVLILGNAPRDTRRHIGYVPQDCALYSDLTVEQNLHYQAGLYGVSEDSFAQLKATYLTNMGLLKFADRLAGQLSGGMKQKLALCCALISKPQLILLDEPTTGLDPIARRELWQILAGLAKEGVTAVIATPFLDEAARCSRIALMYEGEIQLSGSPEELQNALHMRRLEITITNDRNTQEIWDIIKTCKFSNISDIYLYGDRLEVLAKDAKAAETELREATSGKNIVIQSINETVPTMENVFVMRLRELGCNESPILPFPHVRRTVNAGAPSKPGDIAIQADKLTKSFADFRSVDNVSLEIRHGDIYGLLGANGAGKTTTIKMLCGLMEPTSGKVSLAGQNTDLRSKNIRRRIGYMSQKFTLYDTLTVEENLKFYASIYEIPLKLRKRQIDWVTQVCTLGGILRSLVGTLPLGWKQRIAFGAAVMHEPDILFLDEPTAGVDPLARRQLWTMIRDFAQNGAAILVTTHYLDEAEYCNRLAFMAASKIIIQGTSSEIKSHVESAGAIPCSLEDAFIDIVQRSQREAK